MTHGLGEPARCRLATLQLSFSVHINLNIEKVNFVWRVSVLGYGGVPHRHGGPGSAD